MADEELINQLEQVLADLKAGNRDDAGRLSSILGDKIDVGNIEKSQAVAIGHNARAVVKIGTLPEGLIDRLTRLADQLDLHLWHTDLRPYLRQIHHDATQSGLLRTLDPRTNDPALAGKQITVDQVYTPLDTTTRSMSSMQAANQFNHLVVLGDPGSGKSTFVSFLSLALSGHILAPESGWLERLREQGWLHSALLPIYVTLRDFAQDMGSREIHGTTRSLLEHIGRQVAYSGSNPDALETIRYALTEGTALLILDGLDEVPTESREIVRDTVIRTMQSFQDSRLLVTCRILSYTNQSWQIPGTETVTLSPFGVDKIRHFVEAWYVASQAVGSTDQKTAVARIADLTAAIDDPRLRDMASNPMLLTVMAIVHNRQGTLPRETARLYHKCVQILMLRWKPDEARHLREVLDLPDEIDLNRILWQIAYQAHEKQSNRKDAADIPKQEVMSIVAGEHLGNDWHKAQLFCDYVEERAGLLIGRGGQDHWQTVYAFPHRTFQEYLAGCYLADDAEFAEKLYEKAHDGANWRQVVLFAAGHMYFNKTDRNQPLLAVQYMLQDESIDVVSCQATILAAEILLLIGIAALEKHRLGPMLISLARTRLFTLSQSQIDPVERAAAGRTLSQLGDLRRGVGLRGDGLPDIDWCDIPGVQGWHMVDNAGKDYGAYDIAPFRMARYPITYQQFQVFINEGEPGYYNPRWWVGLDVQETHRTVPSEQSYEFDNHPCERIAWLDSIAFCAWLSARLGYPTLCEWLEAGKDWQNYPGVRPPTDWEWQWAAQGPDGREYPYEGLFDVVKGNTAETGIGRTCAVGLFPQGASPYGLLDMSGNVTEWCLNTWEGDTTLKGVAGRVVRGGSWGHNRDFARVTFRGALFPSDRFDYFGFRVACSCLKK